MMKKIIMFLIAFLSLFTIFACTKKDRKKTGISDKNPKIIYNLSNDFSFENKIKSKNNQLFLSENLINSKGKFFFIKQQIDFFSYFEKIEKKPTITFRSEMKVDSILSQNGRKIDYFASKDEKGVFYTFNFDLDHIKNTNFGEFKFPVETGIKYTVKVEDENKNIKEIFIIIKVNVLSEKFDPKFITTIKDGNRINYEKLSSKKYDQNKSNKNILILPGLLEPSIKYENFANEILKGSENLDIYILNMPGINGSSNVNKIKSVSDLKKWFNEVLTEIELNYFDIISFKESSFLVQSFLKDYKLSKKYKINSVNFYNPDNPLGKSIYKNKNETIKNTEEILLSDSKIANLYYAIKNKDYDIIHEYLNKNDNYYKNEKDINKKTNYLNLVINQEGYLNLIHAYNNYNLYGHLYDNSYDNYEEKLNDQNNLIINIENIIDRKIEFYQNLFRNYHEDDYYGYNSYLRQIIDNLSDKDKNYINQYKKDMEDFLKIKNNLLSDIANIKFNYLPTYKNNIPFSDLNKIYLENKYNHIFLKNILIPLDTVISKKPDYNFYYDKKYLFNNPFSFFNHRENIIKELFVYKENFFNDNETLKKLVNELKIQIEIDEKLAIEKFKNKDIIKRKKVSPYQIYEILKIGIFMVQNKLPNFLDNMYQLKKLEFDELRLNELESLKDKKTIDEIIINENKNQSIKTIFGNYLNLITNIFLAKESFKYSANYTISFSKTKEEKNHYKYLAYDTLFYLNKNNDLTFITPEMQIKYEKFHNNYSIYNLINDKEINIFTTIQKINFTPELLLYSKEFSI